jgi:hypothetical protein
MRHEIESYFEPGIAWLGEINRRVLQLEREVSVFPQQHTHLHCALWRGKEGRVGLTLTLSVGNMELYSRAEDSSTVVATRRAFDELHRQLAECSIEFQGKDFWPRSKDNSPALDTRSGTRPGLTTPFMTHSSLAPAHNSFESMRN